MATLPATTVAPAPSSSSAATSPASSAALPPITAAPPATSAPAAAPATFVMPDEVGKGLQEAQDDIQRVSGNPVFITRSSDASGQNRRQILDRNWVVCSQNIPAGTNVSTDHRKTDIVFASVKVGERCP